MSLRLAKEGFTAFVLLMVLLFVFSCPALGDQAVNSDNSVNLDSVWREKYQFPSRQVAGIINDLGGYDAEQFPRTVTFLPLITGLYGLEINTGFQYGELPFSINFSEEENNYYLGLIPDSLLLIIDRENESIFLYLNPDTGMINCLRSDIIVDDDTVIFFRDAYLADFYKFNKEQVDDAVWSYFNALLAENKNN